MKDPAGESLQQQCAHYARSHRKRRRRRWTTTALSCLFLTILLLLHCGAVVAAKKASSYYHTLGVTKDATPRDIKKAYHKACLRHHPDKGGHAHEFKNIQRAYEVLSDPEQKSRYDAWGEAGLHPHNDPSSSSSAAAAGASSFFTPNYNGARQGGGGSSGGGMPQFNFGKAPSFFSFGNSKNGGPTWFGNGGASTTRQQQRQSAVDFEALLQEMLGGGGRGNGFPFAESSTRRPPPRQQQRQASSKVYTRPVHCTLEELYHGVTKTMAVTMYGHRVLYQLDIQPGYQTGTKLKFAPRHGMSATMHFVVTQKPHDQLRRVGDNLVYEHKLDKNDGSMIELSVALPDGTVWRRRIARERCKDDVVVVGKGMPVRKKSHDNTRGDLIIKFVR